MKKLLAALATAIGAFAILISAPTAQADNGPVLCWNGWVLNACWGWNNWNNGWDNDWNRHNNWHGNNDWNNGWHNGHGHNGWD